jgi:hypothetical protein
MQCIFNGGGSSGSNVPMRGGYSIDKTDARLKGNFVPIGLHQHGEDVVYEEPIDDSDGMMEYQEDTAVLDQPRFDEMFYMVMVTGKPKRGSSRTIKKRTKKTG